jgi:hypothetical protein
MNYIRRLMPILLLLGLVGDGPGAISKPTRNFVEFFAGEQSVTKGIRLVGYKGDPVDVRLNSNHDLLTPCGFLVAITMIFSVCKGGLVWIAPPCSTWVWMSRSSTGRSDKSHGTLGDPDNLNVQRQNILVARMCYLLALCWARGVHFIIEQPASSVMMKHPRLVKFFKRLGDAIEHIYLELGSFCLDMKKGTTLSGWAPHLSNMAGTMTPLERFWLRDGGHQVETHTRVVKEGKAKVYGGKDLKATQAYPMPFGCFHAAAYEQHVPLDSEEPLGREHEPLSPGLCDSSDSDDDMGEMDPALQDLVNNDPELFSGRVQLLNELRVKFKD